ncbi:MAG: MgtE integral membrane region [Candidatus Nomurabacteria bacterium GW2011_GWC2_41_8]|uniref:MgtE integral membrane region n=1 Tax=Candidatus Nomurabacteria bacterium GW2011_GWC2_41_8 TaxID=1618755 RepID=A0A0G0XHF0_9BACT|nr:MAG: MgtE integral membrane region [Candidatus Nomurabacteria bacterium GW2011_GWC2_41_8]
MEIKAPKKYTEEDVLKDRVDHLIEHRVPWIILGLLGGLVATVIVSKFEAILSADVRLAFFIPVIVYLSDAVGTQAETIYVRELSEKKINFLKYILKESIIGLVLGIISGVFLGIFAAYWLESSAIGFTLGLTMLVNLTLAPILAVCIPSILYRERADPALGAGPVATIIQDLISLLVYFSIAGIIIF